MLTRVQSGSIVASVAVLVIGVGCSRAGVMLPTGYENLPPCEVRQYVVERLPEVGEPGCNVEGSTLLFPDGTVIAIEEVGTSFVRQVEAPHGPEFHILNWGVPGVGAAFIEDGTVQGVWATSAKALDLHRQQLRVDGY